MNATLVIAALMFAGQTTARPNATSPMGTNLGQLRYWSSEWVFTDAFKQSSEWITGCVANAQPDCAWQTAWDTGEEELLDLDADGWVRSLPAPGDWPTYWTVRTVMFHDIDGRYPAGQYVVLYDGEGTISYSGSATKNVAASAPGRDVIDVVPQNNGIFLELTATDPNHNGNYLRNIRVIMPGFESTYRTQQFHPTFLAKLPRYKAIRFMQWMDVQSSEQRNWTDRPRTTNARYSTRKGVPLETMMALANEASADAWLTIPHLATDDYITQLATSARTLLAASNKLYVEYSNEVWNGSPAFGQSQWVQQQGQARWPNSSADAFTKQMNWYGMRTAQMCDLVKAAFGANRNRVVCVLAGQAANAWTLSQAADCPLWTEGAPCHAHGIDALSIAPYFDVRVDAGSNRAELIAIANQADGGVNAMFTELERGGVLSTGWTGGSLAEATRRMTAAAAVASARNLALVAYEGGQHLVDEAQNDPQIQELFRRVNRDVRMGTFYTSYQNAWRTSGGRLFVHYLNVSKSGRWGPFGLLENHDQTATPKFDSVMRFIDLNPEWWSSSTPPAPPAPANPVPTLTTISPTSITMGAAAFTLTLNGTNYTGATTVRFGTTNVTATRVSATRLTAAIPANLVAAAGSVQVTVSNPAPGGGTTSAQTFTIGRPMYYSMRTATVNVTGLGTIANEDIVRYDPIARTKTLFFDGSVAASVLGAANIDAFFINPDGTIVMSFDVRVTIAGMAGTTVAEPQDLVHYNPATRAWTFYFDASDVGLSVASENVDALGLLPDGRILVSTTGAVSVTGVTGAAEDVLAFSPTGLGVNTTGTWAMYFDGSRVGLSGAAENVDAISPQADGSLLLSTFGNASVTGLTFTGDDVVRFVPTALGSATAGAYSLALGAAGAVISGGVDGIQY
ncbi:IPT/TIG domain-containing protein [Myxococcota bacterium]|nr:IPT/TIG domain-containing protein [Myxococcota bacterium]